MTDYSGPIESGPSVIAIGGVRQEDFNRNLTVGDSLPGRVDQGNKSGREQQGDRD